MGFPGRKLVGALLALTLGMACSSGNDAHSPAAPATPAKITTTTTDPAAEVLAAYLGFWDAAFASLSPPNPDHPALVEFATGAQLEHSQALAADDLAAGIGTRRGDPPTERHPRLADRQGNAAVVVDCYLDTNVLYRIDTGEVVGDDQVLTSVEARLVRVDGMWKVERTVITVVGEGESCDAPSQE